jgi:hypothetical protein
VATHCGRREFPINAVHAIPFPLLSAHQTDEIIRLVTAYRAAVEDKWRISAEFTDADRLLREIDAIVLEAYGLPSRLERRLLDFFSGSQRLVPFSFADYFPRDFTPHFTLKEWLTGRPALSTVERFRSQDRDLPDHIRLALEYAGNDGGAGEE